ncbi:MAG TPA: S53 family peptidase [Chroococcales cyanobacterium]
MPGISDSPVNRNTAVPDAADASAKLSEASNPDVIGMTGVLGGAERIALTTGDGILHIPQGLYNAAVNDLEHPMKIVEAVGGSAALAAGLKLVLPEAGPVGRIAGIAMGAWFAYQSAPGFINAYKDGLAANTWSQLNDAGAKWGNAAGELGVNSALGYAGFKIGAGVSGRVLSGESFDDFADAKQNFWDGTTDKIKGLLHLDTSVPTASSVSMMPNYRIVGDKAILDDSAPKDADTMVGVGRTNPNAERTATIMLESKASALRMDRYINRMADGRAGVLTDENNAFENKFGAKQESLDAVTKFAQEHNLTVTESDLRSGKVVVKGTVENLEKAFDTEINNYFTGDGVKPAHAGALSLPKDLAEHVRAVLGVDARPVATSNYRLQLQESSPEGSGAAVETTSPPPLTPETVPDDFMKKGGYLATDIAKAQNFPLSSGGEGQHGGFISLSGGLDLADYNKFFAEHGLEQPKPLNIVEVDGAKNIPGNGGADTENSLDAVQMQSIAPKADIDMIIGNNDTQGMVNAFERGIFPKNGEAQKSVLSTSWGLAESRQTVQTTNTLGISFRQAMIRGVQIFAGAGDSGARANTNFYQPEYPASDPYVTGVGGLKMVLDDNGKIIQVKAWDEGEPSSTGGGVSKIHELPWWQKSSNVPGNVDTGKVGRGVPDISTNGAKATGFPVRVGGEEFVIGGTSAGAPLYGGLMLNINSELAALGIKQVSPLNPWLYARASNTSIFHNVPDGGNHGYKAGPGWNPVTGLGWVDGQAMLDAMKENQTAKLDGALSGLVPPVSNDDSATADAKANVNK